MTRVRGAGGVTPKDLIGKVVRRDFSELIATGVAQTYADVVRTGKENELLEIFYDSGCWRPRRPCCRVEHPYRALP